MAQAHAHQRPTQAWRATTLQTATMIVGLTFLLVGIAGFIPGITTNYDELAFAGNDSKAELFGLFQVSILHNIVHLAFGVLGVYAARTARTSYLYLVGGGIVYLLLTLYGAVIDYSSDANFVPINTADNWLHLFLGLGMIALGLAFGRDARLPRTAVR